jgi:hypothetical protein
MIGGSHAKLKNGGNHRASISWGQSEYSTLSRNSFYENLCLLRNLPGRTGIRIVCGFHFKNSNYDIAPNIKAGTIAKIPLRPIGDFKLRKVGSKGAGFGLNLLQST